MILDTNFLIDLMDGLPEAMDKLKQLEKEKETQFVAAPSIFELWSGIELSKKPDHEKKKVLAVLQTQFILNLDQKSAEEAGKIDGKLVKEGLTIEPEDSMIAGIAKVHGEKILTRNADHFGRIKEIKVATY